MSDLPERIWVWRNEPGNEVVISVPDQPYPTGSPEYVRKDIADAAVKADRERCIKILRDEQRRLVPKRRTAHHEQTTICDDCGNASLAHSLAVWTEDGASYCPSCRPEIAASPIRKGERG